MLLINDAILSIRKLNGQRMITLGIDLGANSVQHFVQRLSLLVDVLVQQKDTDKT